MQNKPWYGIKKPRFKPSFQFIHFLQIYFLKQTDAKFIIAAQQYKYIFINCLQLKIYASAVIDVLS